MFRALLCPSSGARDCAVVYHIGRFVLGLLYVGSEMLLGWSSVRVVGSSTSCAQSFRRHQLSPHSQQHSPARKTAGCFETFVSLRSYALARSSEWRSSGLKNLNDLKDDKKVE